MRAATFRYTARAADGSVVRGSMQSADAAGVVELLRSRALYVTALDPGASPAARIAGAMRPGVSRAAMLGFFRSFATLMRAGVPIGRALTVAIERAGDARLAETLRSVLAEIEYGASLSDALGHHPNEFPSLYIAMIRAGEAGGVLDDVLDRLAQLLERDATLRRKLRAALAYPAIVMVAASALIVFLIAKIVPMFSEIFAGFHVELPPTTQALLRVGELLSGPLPWFALLAGSATAAMVGLRLARTTGGMLLADRIRLALPIAGPLLHKAIAGRTSRMLATLLRSGVELVSALEAVVPVAGSARYAQALRGVTAALREGESLSRPLAASGLFDPLFLALVRVGEETGLLDEMLLTIADYFESDVEATIATLGAVLEPALIVVLGSIVGFIVCSIFIPLYSLIGSVSR